LKALRFGLALPLVVSLALGGCQVLLGIDGDYSVGDAGVDASDDHSISNADAAEDAQPTTCGDGYACINGAIPEGWVPVAYAADGGAPCPADLSAEEDEVLAGDVADAGDASVQCECNCQVRPCSYRLRELQPGCNPPAIFDQPVHNTECEWTSKYIENGNSFRLNVEDEASCTPVQRTAVEVPGDAGPRARLCLPTAKPGVDVACERGCLQVAAPYRLCIAHEGTTECPAGFHDRLTPTTRGDNRCGGCTCGLEAGACSEATINFYHTGPAQTCSGYDRTTKAGVCNVHDDLLNPIKGYRFYAPPASCKVTSAPTQNPEGGLTRPVTRTVCCP
jgi:hypothetical protein